MSKENKNLFILQLIVSIILFGLVLWALPRALDNQIEQNDRYITEMK